MSTDAELTKKIKALSLDLPAPLKREVGMVLHKIRYPMTKILAKVPGASLTERAKALKVSRQTMYVWMSEKFRPTPVQAKRISKITGIPVTHIIDNGFEVEHDLRRKAREKAARVAARLEKAAVGNDGDEPGRRGAVDAGSGDSAA